MHEVLHRNSAQPTMFTTRHRLPPSFAGLSREPRSARMRVIGSRCMRSLRTGTCIAPPQPPVMVGLDPTTSCGRRGRSRCMRYSNAKPTKRSKDTETRSRTAAFPRPRPPIARSIPRPHVRANRKPTSGRSAGGGRKERPVRFRRPRGFLHGWARIGADKSGIMYQPPPSGCPQSVPPIPTSLGGGEP